MRETIRDVADRLYICLQIWERRVRGAVRSREGRGRSLSGTHDREVARYWAGLRLLVRLSEAGTELSSGEVGALLGTRSVKGIGAALSGTRDTLFAAGIRMDEAAIRRTVRGRSVWTGGPRIRQAIHVLEQERYLWTESGGRDVVPFEGARPDEPGPVLVLRALKSRGNVYRIDSGMAELDEILEDDRFEIGNARRESIREIFGAGIEPGDDGREHPVPDGYGENGIWVRGEHDYAEARVADAIGTGIRSTIIAWVGEATRVERWMRFVDAPRQVAKVRAENSRSFSSDAIERWRDIEEESRFRYVSWIAARGLDGPRHAPPLRTRLRCRHEVVIGTAEGRRIVLREEGCVETTRARRAGRSGAGVSWRARGRASRSQSASSGSRRGSLGPCQRTGRRAMKAPVRLAAMQGSCRTEVRWMTGWSRHEVWTARHEAGESAVACVVPGRFPNLAEAGDRPRPAKVLPTALAPGMS